MDRKPQFSLTGVRHATINGHRFHLRLTDPTEENFLWIDGKSPPLVLDQVAAEFLGHLIDAMWKMQQGSGDESEKVRKYVVEQMFKQYGLPFAIGNARVTRKRIRSDLDRIFGTLMAIAEGTCPLEEGLAMEEIHQEKWASPARMDVAVTYRCNLNCPHCYNGGPRDMKELSANDWIKIYKILWNEGISQVVFTGGEPFVRGDIVQLVSEAEEFVTGMVTNGVLLEEKVDALQKASLDYIQVTLESFDSAVHNSMVGASIDAHQKTVNGIKKSLERGMEVVTNTTLISKNVKQFSDTIKFGKEIGLSSMACNALICSGRGRSAKQKDPLTLGELKNYLENALKTAREIGINLQWYTPTCYYQLDPVSLGFGPKSCSAAAYNMTVQPDGTVLPCQSWPESVGNILDDPWQNIWNHTTCTKLRTHEFGRTRKECSDCNELILCGGGCPLDVDNPGKVG
jgi:radical SAM protein with 4Fe4S-binding SPASM domain